MPAVTLKEIAKRSRVSFQAVSGVLNNTRTGSRVSAKTRERILRIAGESGYQPHFAYQLIRGKKTKTVAILASTPRTNAEEHILKLVHLLLARFNRLEHSAYCGVFTLDPGANLDQVRSLIRRGVERFVFLGVPVGHLDIIGELDGVGLPYIANSKGFPRWVNHGSRLGRTALFRHFAARVGRERVRLIYPDPSVSASNNHLEALASLHPELAPKEVLERYVFASASLDFEGGDPVRAAYSAAYEATRELLNRDPGVGAIAYADDNSAIGGARYLLEPAGERFRGLLLGGFTNCQDLHNFPLPISSVALRLETVADRLVEHVLTEGPCRLSIPPVLHLREPGRPDVYPPWTETVVPLADETAAGDGGAASP